MNQHEEDLQKKFEQGKPIPSGPDEKAYEVVFRALKRDPGYSLPSNFAEQVAAAATKGSHRERGDYFWFGAGIFFLLVAFVANILFTGVRLDFGFMKVLSDYRGLLVFGVVLIVLLNWLDKKLVREKHIGHEL